MTTSAQSNIKSESRRKVALIIGIDDYENGQKLKNAKNDAVDMSNTLKNIGFAIVTLELNLKYVEMEVALTKFKTSIQETDMVLFYFAGHGQQWHGENYLIPKDNKDINAGNVSKRTINAQYILNIISDRDPYITIFLLDCCRTFSKTRGRSDTTTNRQSDGLTAMSARAGSLIAFACAPGTIADDGESERNGLFTKHLLKHIIIPNEDIRMVLADVTDAVINESNSNQVPFTSATLRHKNIFLCDQFSAAQEFASPGTFEAKFCKGRLCSKCGNCRDWYFTGDRETWHWIQNWKNWKDNDWKRWDNDRVSERFKRRDGATCTHGFSRSGYGHHSGVFGGHGVHYGFCGFHYDDLYVCVCEDNIKK